MSPWSICKYNGATAAGLVEYIRVHIISEVKKRQEIALETTVQRAG